MKTNILVFLILSTLIVELTSCSSGSSNRVLIINNQITSSHVRFKGTRTFLILPEEYTFNKIDPQFYNDKGVTIRVLELKDKKFVQDDYTKEQGHNLGMIINEWQKVKIQDMDGVLLFCDNREDSSLNKGMLIFGDTLNTTLVLAKFPKQNIADKEIIKGIFRSVVNLRSYNFYPQELSIFDINLSNTNFKFRTNTTNTFTYTINGQGNPNSDAELTRIDIVQYTKLINLKQVEHFINNILTSYIEDGYALTDTKSTSYRNEQINCYETISKGHYNGKYSIIYILLLQSNDATLMFHGISYTDHERYLNIFKTAAETLTFKDSQLK